MIFVWDVDYCGVYIFKIVYYFCFKIDYKCFVVDVVMVMVVVFIYYKCYWIVEDVGLFDGGVWVNNLIVLVVVEVVILFDWLVSSL